MGTWRLSHTEGDVLVLWQPTPPGRVPISRRIKMRLHECGVVHVHQGNTRIGSSIPQHQIDEVYYRFLALVALKGRNFQGDLRSCELNL